MRIQELDPNKQYAVILQGDYFSQDDLERVSEKLKAKGVNAVVIAGADVRSAERYWGIYFTKDRAWLKRTDGSLYFYPSPDIARAHLDELGMDYQTASGEVAEFGQEPNVLENVN